MGAVDASAYVLKKWKIQIRHKAFDLSTKVVTVDTNIESTNQILSTLLGPICRLGKQNQAGTSAPGWLPVQPEPLLNMEIDADGVPT